MDVFGKTAQDVIDAAKTAEPKVEAFFSGKKKKWIALAIGALLLLALGYGAGRYASPAKEVTKDKIVTRVQEKVVYQDRVVTQKVTVEVQKRDTHRSTVTSKKPDGTVVTIETVDEHVDEDEKTGTKKSEASSGTTERRSIQTVEHTRVVEGQPNWHFRAGVGISVPYYLGQGSVGVPGLKGVVVEVGADRRIFGPASLGVWANTQGALGVEAAVSW